MSRDEGPRETTLAGLAGLRTNLPDGVHTAGTSSQISDGAGAVLMMTREKAQALGLTPKATIVDTCLVGSDPVLMLTGPIFATQKLLAANGMQMSDIDVVEINEAFAYAPWRAFRPPTRGPRERAARSIRVFPPRTHPSARGSTVSFWTARTAPPTRAQLAPAATV